MFSYTWWANQINERHTVSKLRHTSCCATYVMFTLCCRDTLFHPELGRSVAHVWVCVTDCMCDRFGVGIFRYTSADSDAGVTHQHHGKIGAGLTWKTIGNPTTQHTSNEIFNSLFLLCKYVQKNVWESRRKSQGRTGLVVRIRLLVQIWTAFIIYRKSFRIRAYVQHWKYYRSFRSVTNPTPRSRLLTLGLVKPDGN